MVCRLLMAAWPEALADKQADKMLNGEGLRDQGDMPLHLRCRADGHGHQPIDGKQGDHQQQGAAQDFSHCPGSFSRFHILSSSFLRMAEFPPRTRGILYFSKVRVNWSRAPQLCGHHRDLGDVRLPCPAAPGAAPRSTPHPAAVDVDGGELRLQHSAGGAVVQSRHRQVLRHPAGPGGGAAFMAPGRAITSFPPKMAVGRSCRSSSSRQASAALSTVGAAQLDVPGCPGRAAVGPWVTSRKAR